VIFTAFVWKTEKLAYNVGGPFTPPPIRSLRYWVENSRLRIWIIHNDSYGLNIDIV